MPAANRPIVIRRVTLANRQWKVQSQHFPQNRERLKFRFWTRQVKTKAFQKQTLNNSPFCITAIGQMTERESAHPSPHFADFAPLDETEAMNELDEASAAVAHITESPVKESPSFQRTVAQVN